MNIDYLFIGFFIGYIAGQSMIALIEKIKNEDIKVKVKRFIIENWEKTKQSK